MSYIPTKADEKRLAETLQKLREKLVGLELIDVGSTAKGTWLRDQSDIDIYVICEDKTITHELVKQLWSKGHEKKGQLTIWNFPLNGFDVDLVLVDKEFKKREDTTKHTTYFNRVLTDYQRNEVRKAKAYLKTKGVYGAEIGGIVGVAIERLVELQGNFKAVCILLVGPRPYVQDPTMTEERDLLACISSKRWKQLQKACKAYLANPNFEYRVMTSQEFIELYPRHSTLMFKRRMDKALDAQTAQSTATKVSRILRHYERDVTVDIDTYVDSNRIVICHRVRPVELAKIKEVCIDLKLARGKAVKGFKAAHPNNYKKNGKVCAKVERHIRFPDTYFCIQVTKLMEEKGWELL